MDIMRYFMQAKCLQIFCRYPHEAIENASDMFLVSPTTSCKYQKGDMEHSGFNGSNLDQLWNVFDSAIVDESLRESAAEQLSVLVQGIFICICALY